ncbi:MAG: hypothetical protein ACF8XB_05495 [Planctomycetota bacterium JB042]
MKSAYELAMERLEQEKGPSKKLTEDQKAAIADLDKKYDARIAETRLGYESKIAVADYNEQVSLKQELAEKIQDLESQREKEKEAVWNSA